MEMGSVTILLQLVDMCGVLRISINMIFDSQGRVGSLWNWSTAAWELFLKAFLSPSLFILLASCFKARMKLCVWVSWPWVELIPKLHTLSSSCSIGQTPGRSCSQSSTQWLENQNGSPRNSPTPWAEVKSGIQLLGSASGPACTLKLPARLINPWCRFIFTGIPLYYSKCRLQYHLQKPTSPQEDVSLEETTYHPRV